METSPASATPSPDGSVARSLRHMVDEADKLLKSSVAAGDRKFDEARMKLEHQLDSMRMQLDDLEQGAVHRARQAARSADRAVHDHPYGAIGIGALAGLLIGALLARR